MNSIDNNKITDLPYELVQQIIINLPITNELWRTNKILRKENDIVLKNLWETMKEQVKVSEYPGLSGYLDKLELKMKEKTDKDIPYWILFNNLFEVCQGHVYKVESPTMENAIQFFKGYEERFAYRLQFDKDFDLMKQLMQNATYNQPTRPSKSSKFFRACNPLNLLKKHKR